MSEPLPLYFTGDPTTPVHRRSDARAIDVEQTS